MTTKIVALVDALGCLVRFVLLPGQRHDMVGVEPLIRNVCFDALLGDKAFDVDWLRAELNQRGASTLCPAKWPYSVPKPSMPQRKSIWIQSFSQGPEFKRDKKGRPVAQKKDVNKDRIKDLIVKYSSR